jgi:hypothetical protein
MLEGDKIKIYGLILLAAIIVLLALMKYKLHIF